MSLDLMSVALRWVWKTAALAAVLASVFNNGWIMILLEHMAAHSQSAADQFVRNSPKTDHNSLVGKEFNWSKKMTSRQFL